ncbi:MAG: PulJ/GspJ family protein [Thalassotalea sp.]
MISIKQGSLKKATGFTLLELVTVIVLLSVISVGVSSFISIATQSFVNTSERDELIASARFAVERINRELRDALPNSARTLSFASGENCLEFVPIAATSTYLNADFTKEVSQLDAIQFLNAQRNEYTCTDTCGDSVVIYPLSSSDIYVNPMQTQGQLFAIENVTKPTANVWQFNLANTVNVDYASPTERLYIVNQPVRYCVDDNNLYRETGYSLSTALADSVYPNDSEVLMAENVNVNFLVNDATLTRNSVVQMTLTFSRASDSSEQVVFNHEVHISNTP